MLEGSTAYVVNTVTSENVDTVLKVEIPSEPNGESAFDRAILTLKLGGDCYVRVLKVDANRRATLQERLGRPLSNCGLTVEAQIEVLTTTIQQGWTSAPAGTLLPSGSVQARSLAASIQQRWIANDRPCSDKTIKEAQQYLENRLASLAVTEAVLVHGDAHPANLLEDLSGVHPPSFKLIDPEGLLSEPAHDLGIPLRGWSAELLDGDPLALGKSWCELLSEQTGVDEQAIWEWAFIERVSTGLLLLSLGDQQGELFLRVAAEWT